MKSECQLNAGGWGINTTHFVFAIIQACKKWFKCLNNAKPEGIRMRNVKTFKKIATLIVLAAVGWGIYVNLGLFCCTSF